MLVCLYSKMSKQLWFGTMKQIFIFFVIFVAAALKLYANDLKNFNADQIFSSQNIKTYDNQLQVQNVPANNLIKIVKLNKANADLIFNRAPKEFSINNFPINTKENAKVILKRRVSAVDSKSEWYKQTKNGAIPIPAPVVNSFSGIIEGYPDTKVQINYSNGFLFAYVKSTDGFNYDIGSSSELDENNIPKIYISEQNIKSKVDKSLKPYYSQIEKEFTNLREKDLFNKNIDKKLSNNLLECRIAIDAIYSFYEMMGKDIEKTQAYLAAIMSHVSVVYEDFINVRLYISYALIREDKTIDPYYTAGIKDFEQKLYFLREIWHNQRPENAAIVCLFSAMNDKEGDSSIGGLSFGGDPGAGSLCDMMSGYCMVGIKGNTIFPNYNYTWDVGVVAHEMGHNFGAPHTHSCFYYPNLIDTCVSQAKPYEVWDACYDGEPIPSRGTIMSYCHLTNGTRAVELVFHPREAAHMRLAAESSNCLSIAKDPYINFVSPLLSKKYIPNNVIPIKWTYAKVDYINVYYSTNKGETWELIEGNISSNKYACFWKAPAMNIDTVFFKVEDANNPEINDISSSSIKIMIPRINIEKPINNSQFSNKEILTAVWNANYSETFDFYFSDDDGKTWELLADSINNNYYVTALSGINSQECRIKVLDATNDTIISFSDKFSVGKEIFEITAPKAGEKLCANNNYMLKWNSENVDKVLLMYSLNSGEVWKKLQLSGIEANSQEFLWKVPSVKSEKVKIKAVLNVDKSIMLDSTEYEFVIDSCTTSVDEELSRELKLNIISPNPANSIINVHFENNSASKLTISVYNSMGQYVFGQSINSMSGENIYTIDINSLPNGEYFLKISNGTDNVTNRFVVMR